MTGANHSGALCGSARNAKAAAGATGTVSVAVPVRIPAISPFRLSALVRRHENGEDWPPQWPIRALTQNPAPRFHSPGGEGTWTQANRQIQDEGHAYDGVVFWGCSGLVVTEGAGFARTCGPRNWRMTSQIAVMMNATIEAMVLAPSSGNG